METNFVTGSGTAIRIGRELGKGGEGSVYEVAASPNRVAKLYHQVPDPLKQQKLRFMASHADQTLMNYAAWPIDTLHASGTGPVVGFVMPRFARLAPVHMLYSPAHRRQEYPRAAWDFLLMAARNMAAAFSTLHAHGHVVGDVNQGNILVGEDARIALMDCDSFQIRAGGMTHRCDVGVSHFTPPELQQLPSFDAIERSTRHDEFGLALLVFHLLFGGRHPYSGVPLRKTVGDALESDIAAFRFAYARDARSRGIAPPPHSIPVSIVPTEMQTMFEHAFTERGASLGRPTALQWIAALDSLRVRLKRCAGTPMHAFSSHLNHCPWCALENRGIVYFTEPLDRLIPAASDFDLDKVWSDIDCVPAPSAPALPKFPRITPSELPSAKGLSHGTRGVLLTLTVLSCAVALVIAAPKLALLLLPGAWIVSGFAGSLRRRRRAVEEEQRRVEFAFARKEYDALIARVRKEIGPDHFHTKKAELASLRDEYRTLCSDERAALTTLKASAESRQKMDFLSRCFIDNAAISGVGSAKKAALHSFGIETAADVTAERVQRVRGFGAVLTRAVVKWKMTCERRFVFIPHKLVADARSLAIRARLSARKRTLENQLRAGPAELQHLRQEAITKAAALQPQLDSAVDRLAQAHAWHAKTADRADGVSGAVA